MDEEYEEDVKRFDKLEDELVEQREKGENENWIVCCPGCKKVVTNMRISRYGNATFACNCGYPGPLVWIEETDIKNGTVKKKLEEIEKEFYRENPEEFKK